MKLLEWIGRRFRLLGGELLDLIAMIHISLFSIRHLMHGSRRRVFLRLLVRHIKQAGTGSLYLISAIAMLCGALLIAMMHRFFEASAFDDIYGQFYLIVILRELAPLLCGIVLIARSATALTAEIGYLKMQHEFDTLRLMGVDPVTVFLLPVFFAFPLVLLTSMVYFCGMSIIGGWLMSLQLDAGMDFLEFVGGVVRHFNPGKVPLVLGKPLIAGFFIGVICIYFGSKTGDKFTDMTTAIARGATAQLIIFFTINISFSLVLYLQ